MEANTAEHVLNGHEPEPRQLVHILPQQLPNVWDLIEPVLSKACADSGGEFSLNRILANLEHWPILAMVRGDDVQAVMVTCVTLRADGVRVLDCLLAGGDHAKEWPFVDSDFDEFARALGCSVVRIPRGRKGWLKTLPHWKLTGSFVTLEREI